MKRIFLFLSCLLVFSVEAAPEIRPGFDWETVSRIAIQDRGRVKPLETFATESVLYVTGKRSWKGMSAVEVLFSWLMAYDKEWQEEAFIRVAYNPLKEAMGLDVARSYFSPQELEGNSGLQNIIRDSAAKENRKERLTEIEKKAVQLQNQKGLIEAILSGRSWDILPNPNGLDKDWVSLASLGEQNEPLPYTEPEVRELAEKVRSLINAYTEKNSSRWKEASVAFAGYLRTLSQGNYPSATSISVETHYNGLRPFRWAWIFYALSFVTLLWMVVAPQKANRVLSFVFIAVAFGLHNYGFVLRMIIAGRPPVTNMYESVIWVTWGCVLFALVIFAIYRNAAIITAATVFSVVGLVLADNLPSVLDPSINPLEPVLRSNFWLTIHVLTITLSYAAFALSLCLGNVVLGNYLWRPHRTETIQQYSLYMYRSVQIGVVLLAAGTILGGVWADYSWGRFWGWDPKEVWALIALLLYLAVLHGRFTGWLKGFGFAATTVISFLGVLMAWYGVNFVLGVGLHSYGFGSGGVKEVSLYILAQLGFIAAAYSRYRKAQKNLEPEPAILPR